MRSGDEGDVLLHAIGAAGMMCTWLFSFKSGRGRDFVGTLDTVQHKELLAKLVPPVGYEFSAFSDEQLSKATGLTEDVVATHRAWIKQIQTQMDTPAQNDTCVIM